jgi:acetaldehyde dehydrogenase (acetylating)
MTLGCGSWGGNVTSDNVSPLHLMDIKRVAWETRPVKGVRPAVTSGVGQRATPAPAKQPAVAAGKVNREEIAAIVDRFLAGKHIEPQVSSPLPKPVVEAGSMYEEPDTATVKPTPPPPPPPRPAPPVAANGHAPVDFVSEDDVRRAIQKGSKIYINARTIITPAARDIGEPAEVFAKV